MSPIEWLMNRYTDFALHNLHERREQVEWRDRKRDDAQIDFAHTRDERGYQGQTRPFGPGQTSHDLASLIPSPMFPNPTNPALSFMSSPSQPAGLKN